MRRVKTLFALAVALGGAAAFCAGGSRTNLWHLQVVLGKTPVRKRQSALMLMSPWSDSAPGSFFHLIYSIVMKLLLMLCFSLIKLTLTICLIMLGWYHPDPSVCVSVP